jgi:hypothetical protein
MGLPAIKTIEPLAEDPPYDKMDIVDAGLCLFTEIGRFSEWVHKERPGPDAARMICAAVLRDKSRDTSRCIKNFILYPYSNY